MYGLFYLTLISKVRDKEILEKPSSPQHATAMLTSLSGRAHEVYTGVVVLHCPPNTSEPTLHLFHEMTQVHFGQLSPETIEAYVASGEPMDKAGSYGIQGSQCRSFIETIHGCYNNVVGFPLHRFCKELHDLLRYFCFRLVLISRRGINNKIP